jgi:hypothetical protein
MQAVVAELSGYAGRDFCGLERTRSQSACLRLNSSLVDVEAVVPYQCRRNLMPIQAGAFLPLPDILGQRKRKLQLLRP